MEGGCLLGFVGNRVRRIHRACPFWGICRDVYGVVSEQLNEDDRN